MDSPQAAPESSLRGSAAFWAAIRVIVFGIGGIGTGLLSCRLMNLGDLAKNTWIWVSAPGFVYGLFWLSAGWIPGALFVRHRIRRSWIWSLAFLAGITLSYIGAYYTAYYFVLLTDRTNLHQFDLAIAGFLGGIPGSLGLVCCWAILFPPTDSWYTKSVLSGIGALLGITLFLWDPNEPAAISNYLFFAIWQGGMAMAFSAVDSAGRLGKLDHART